MRHAVALFCMLLAGCASAPATPEQSAAAVGGAAGCFAQGVVSAADSGKGELLVAGILLMPLCAMLASNNPERFQPHSPWVYGRAPKSRTLVSRK